MTVKDITRYHHYGARDAEARAAGTLATKMWRVRTARFGPQSADAGPTQRRLNILHRRMTWVEMEAVLPVTRWQLIHIAKGRAKRVTLPTADAVERLWFDVCAEPEKDRRRWPVLPFKEAVIARYGTIKALGNTNQVRQIWRGGTLSTKQAETYAESLGLLPVEIWPDWYVT